jgi:RNA polymerase sigma factor (sigma-70 family)
MDDKDILAKFKDASTKEHGFTLLVSKYQERLYWHIRRMVLDHEDANDVLQNAFIKIWKGMENFREESQLYTWLYRIASNESITFLNSKKKKMAIPMDDVSKYLSEKLTTGNNFSGDEIQLKLQKAILELPDRQREVFNLRYYDEMPYEEMSEALQTSVGALKASYHHAAKKVEEYLLNH